MNHRIFAVAGLAALLFAAWIAPGHAHGQVPPVDIPTFHTASFLGIGVVGNAPAAAVGLSGTMIRHRGFGVYADGRMSLYSPGREPYFMPGISRDEAERRDGDEWLREQDAWLSANVAVVRPVSHDVAFYVGGGFAYRSTYSEFFDETARRGQAGYYWVEDPDETGGRLNILGGMIVQAGRRLFFQAGVDLAPRGFTLGAMYAIPRR